MNRRQIVLITLQTNLENILNEPKQQEVSKPEERFIRALNIAEKRYTDLFVPYAHLYGVILRHKGEYHKGYG